MPNLFAPHKSGVHRHACLALYRALLKQTAAIYDTTLDSDSVRTTIRHRFRKDKKILSPSKAANGLKAGYEAYDLLHHAAQGSEDAISRLTSLLITTRDLHEKQDNYRKGLREVQPPPSTRFNRRLEHARQRMSKEYQTGRLNNAKPILERPLPFEELKIRPRRVPQYVVASGSGVPFLRYGKPQSIMLSRLLRQKLEQYSNWQQQKLHNEMLCTWARDENQWDDIIASQMKCEGIQLSEGSTTPGQLEHWDLEHERVTYHLNEKMTSFMSKNRRMGKKLWDIKEKEQELANLERAQGKDGTGS